jgi:hypothetical protein
MMMRSKVRIISFGLVAASILFLTPSIGSACTCGLPYPIRTLKQQVSEARRLSAGIFAGEVVEVIDNPEALYVVVKLRVIESWKPVTAKEATVYTGRGGGDCGYSFQIGENYLVYAYKYNKTVLGTNICQRTQKLRDAAQDLRLLGKGRLTVPRSRALPTNTDIRLSKGIGKRHR